MRLLSPFIALISLCAVSRALHEIDVGVVDWHKELIGVPLAGTASTSPSFHRVQNKSLIIAATSSNVLAALDPEDGSVVWRYLFDEVDRIAGYYKNGAAISTLSGVNRVTIRTFNSANGDLLLEKKLPEEMTPSDHVQDLVSSPSSPYLYILTNGYSIHALDSETRDFKWHWTSPDQGSLIVHDKLLFDNDKLYVIGFAKSIASYTLHVTILDPSTGEVLRSSNIHANILNPSKEFAVVTHPSFPHPVALWLEKGQLRHVPLPLRLDAKPKSSSDSGYVQIQDVGVNGQVVVLRQNGVGIVFEFDPDKISTRALWEFEDTTQNSENPNSMYVSSFDSEGRPYIGRIFWSYSSERGMADVFAKHIFQGRSTETVFQYDIKQHGSINDVVLDSHNPYDLLVESRLLIVSKTGSIQLWDGDSLKWTREEGLTSIAAAQFVEIPEGVAMGGNLDHDSEDYVSRFLRHISSLQDFPRYAINFATRFVTGSYALPSKIGMSGNTSSEGLYRDPFGFRQIVVMVTKLGKVYGIDSISGKIIWSRIFALGPLEGVESQTLPLKLHVTKTVGDSGDPEVVLVVLRGADNNFPDTVIFHLDVMTGQDLIGDTVDQDLRGHHIVSAPHVESYFLNQNVKTVVLLDESMQIHIYPDTPITQAAFRNVAQNLSFALISKNESTSRVIGHQISFSEDKFKPVAYPTWSLAFANGEVVQSIISPTARGPIASFGKVLGNRTTLYKYLNPRLFTALTSLPTKRKCGLYVLDSMKGTIVYHTEVNMSARGCEIKTALIDNWLVYHYYNDIVGTAGTKGYRMVSVEFYEGQGIDENTRSVEISAFSDENANFHFYEQSYVLPSALTALAPTNTRFGIANKDIIIATTDNKVRFIPRSLLNPRRPNRKVTAEEVEEMLLQYDPVLPNDPKRVLSHNYKVASVQNIISSPALLESTSLVFAYGLDMFLTRLAPSGTFDVLSENFNKAQLVFTVCGLFVAVIITGPIMRRKQLRDRWYH